MNRNQLFPVLAHLLIALAVSCGIARTYADPPTPKPVDTPKNAADQRQKRQDRWKIILNTKSGDDYIQQLNALGAYVKSLGQPSSEQTGARGLATATPQTK